MHLIQALHQRASELTQAQELTPLLQEFFFQCSIYADDGLNLSVYDLAWVLCSDTFPSSAKQRYLSSLTDQQHPEGHWGTLDYLPHSSLLDTLAASKAYIANGAAIPHYSSVETAVAKALLDIEKSTIYHDTAGFEFLAPLHIDWLRQHGAPLALGEEAEGVLEQIRAKGAPKWGWIQKHMGEASQTASFAAETFALVELSREQAGSLCKMILGNGSIGNSPAATAGVIIALKRSGLTPPHELYNYLSHTLTAYHGAGFPPFHSASHSHRLWVALPWLLNKELSPLMKADAGIADLVRRSYDHLVFNPNGTVAWDRYNPMLADLDDSSVAHALRLVQGEGSDEVQWDLSFLTAFRDESGQFFCFPHETHSSPVALLHAIMALEYAIAQFGTKPELEDFVSALLADEALQQDDIDALCRDKWNIAWAYGAQRWLSLATLWRKRPEIVTAIASASLERQLGDGGWGEKGSSLEETAYLVSGLIAFLESPLSVQRRDLIGQALQRAGSYMQKQMESPTFHAIWISKTLYLPRYWASSAVLNAWYSFLKWQSRSSQGR